MCPAGQAQPAVLHSAQCHGDLQTSMSASAPLGLIPLLESKGAGPDIISVSTHKGPLRLAVLIRWLVTEGPRLPGKGSCLSAAG